MCRGAEQENGRYSVDDDVGTPPPSNGAFDASPPSTSMPVQALVAPVLLQTSGTSTELFSDGHCTLPPFGIVLPPKAVIVGAAAGGVVEGEVVLGLVDVGGVLLDREELRVVAGAEDADDRFDDADVPEEVGVPPDPVGSAGPPRAIRYTPVAINSTSTIAPAIHHARRSGRSGGPGRRSSNPDDPITGGPTTGGAGGGSFRP